MKNSALCDIFDSTIKSLDCWGKNSLYLAKYSNLNLFFFSICDFTGEKIISVEKSQFSDKGFDFCEIWDFMGKKWDCKICHFTGKLAILVQNHKFYHTNCKFCDFVTK